MKKIIMLIITIFNIQLLNSNAISLSLEEAFSLGIQNNLDIKISKIIFNDAKVSAYTVWNAFLPGFSASGSLGTTLSASADMNMSISARSFVGVFDTIIEYKKGELTYKKAVKTVKKDIAKIYYNLVVLKEELAIRELSMKTAKTRYEQGIRGFKAGEIGQIDVLRREYTYRTSLSDFEERSNVYNQTFSQFKILLGIEDDKDIEFSDKVPDIRGLDLSECKGLDIQKNIAVETIKLEERSAEIRKAYAIALFLPSISAGASVNGSYKNKVNYDIFPVDNKLFDSKTSFRISVSVPLSGILPFSQDQIAIIKAENNKKKTALSLDKKVIEVKSQLKTTMTELDFILASYKNGLLNYEIAEKVVVLTEKAYNEGSKEYLDLTTALQDFQSAQVKLLQNRLLFMTKILDLEYDFQTDLLKNIQKPKR